MEYYTHENISFDSITNRMSSHNDQNIEKAMKVDIPRIVSVNLLNSSKGTRNVAANSNLEKVIAANN